MCHWIGITEGFKTEHQRSKVNDVMECKHSGLVVPSFAKPSIDKAPGLPPETGYHGYIFLLLEGYYRHLAAPDDRQHWGFEERGHGFRDWAEREGLEFTGANSFYAKNKRQ
jgi:hypothetical protein